MTFQQWPFYLGEPRAVGELWQPNEDLLHRATSWDFDAEFVDDGLAELGIKLTTLTTRRGFNICGDFGA